MFPVAQVEPVRFDTNFETVDLDRTGFDRRRVFFDVLVSICCPARSFVVGLPWLQLQRRAVARAAPVEPRFGFSMYSTYGVMSVVGGPPSTAESVGRVARADRLPHVTSHSFAHRPSELAHLLTIRIPSRSIRAEFVTVVGKVMNSTLTRENRTKVS